MMTGHIGFIASMVLAAALPLAAMAQTNPVTRLPRRHRDVFHRADMPEIPSRGRVEFAPTALRFGTGENDVAFFLFDARRRGEPLPDTVYVWIRDHAEYHEPKPFRGRPTREDNRMEFREIGISSEDAGVKRHILLTITKNRGETGFIAYEATVTAEYQGTRTVMTIGQKPTFATMHMSETRVRVQSLFEDPLLQLRVSGDGSEVACSLTMGRDWFLLPREGMDTEITVDVRDSTGQLAGSYKIPANPRTYIDAYSWTIRLRNLKRDERYEVQARIHLGPWYGELKQSVTTQLTDRRL